jgi:hypothetical protein
MKYASVSCNDKLVVILVSKKRTRITEKGIFLMKGKSTKNAIIKLRGHNVPKGINIKNYTSFFVDSFLVEHIPYFN